MTGDETEKSTAGADPAGKPEAAKGQVKGIKSRLTDAQKEMLASKSRGGTTSQSVGHSHKPTHASGKQGPTEKKVRW
jgi:hypothetical protein